MTPRQFLIPLLIAFAASAAPASAQTKGTVDAKPLPPLANPNDPKLGAKELFARRYLPAAADKPRVVGFYAKGCIAGAEGLPINGEAWQVMRLSRNRYWAHPDMVALVKRLAIKAKKDAGWPGILVGVPATHKLARKGHTEDSMETPVTKVTILPLPRAANAVEDLRAGRGGGRAGSVAAVLVAGADAGAVGEAVAGLRAVGIAAAGWVGDPSDPAVREMAAEVFPGCEVVALDAG